jgi:hypothetical protein
LGVGLLSIHTGGHRQRLRPICDQTVCLRRGSINAPRLDRAPPRACAENPSAVRLSSVSWGSRLYCGTVAFFWAEVRIESATSNSPVCAALAVDWGSLVLLHLPGPCACGARTHSGTRQMPPVFAAVAPGPTAADAWAIRHHRGTALSGAQVSVCLPAARGPPEGDRAAREGRGPTPPSHPLLRPPRHTALCRALPVSGGRSGLIGPALGAILTGLHPFQRVATEWDHRVTPA